MAPTQLAVAMADDLYDVSTAESHRKKADEDAALAARLLPSAVEEEQEARPDWASKWVEKKQATRATGVCSKWDKKGAHARCDLRRYRVTAPIILPFTYRLGIHQTRRYRDGHFRPPAIDQPTRLPLPS